MIAFFDPEPAAAVLVGEGLAPVVAVLVASAKADESIAAPKGVDPRTRAAFSLYNSPFRGPREGGHHRVLGFRACRRQARGEGFAPLGQYFSRLGNQTPFTLLDRPDLKAEPRF
jgi:hypothetical protein